MNYRPFIIKYNFIIEGSDAIIAEAGGLVETGGNAQC